ncbi:hypothetical protein H5410_003009 [Solanum commersonii]|uniref:Uncharacterized protein n=1 Tax=Solanum commersonii TaxID=4109 RepID=A0A9J6B3S9_SOLCO|nr:hypothetical protein H5410_003009 [Solanum commersonii]
MEDCCTARNLMFYVADVANKIDLKGSQNNGFVIGSPSMAKTIQFKPSMSRSIRITDNAMPSSVLVATVNNCSTTLLNHEEHFESLGPYRDDFPDGFSNFHRAPTSVGISDIEGHGPAYTKKR